VDNVISALVHLTETGDIPIYSMGDLREDKINQWETALEKGFVGVPFCLPSVNSILGGWRNGCFSIIGAYRGSGKSTLARQDAYHNAMNGRNVLLLSLEDPADIAGAGIAGLHSGQNTFLLDKGEGGQTMIDKLNNGWKEIADMPLRIISCPLTMTKIVATAEMLHKKQPLDIIYVDHIQFISPLIMPHMSRNDTLSHYSLELSGLAKRLNIPVVALSQLNRNSEQQNRKPKLSDLRDSGSLEQDARQVLILFWDGEKKHFQIEVAKNNYGASFQTVGVYRCDGKNKFEEVKNERV
jgi:replicative DNA helicase